MDESTIIRNMIGTAFNVLQEQDHPDIDKMAEAMRNNSRTLNMEGRGNGALFDLRHRRLDGTKIN